MRRSSLARGRRYVTAGLIALAAAGLFAVVASADAPDVKVNPALKSGIQQRPVVTATATTNADSTVTVTVKGGWSWPTHGSDCNTNRAGAGVAIDWFDSKDPGYPLGASATVNGVSTPILVGSNKVVNGNILDDVVHPTENDNNNTGVVVDPAPSPTTGLGDYTKWRGGCGKYGTDTILVANSDGTFSTVSGATAYGNFGKVAPGDLDANTTAFNNPTPQTSSVTWGAELKHTYASKADLKTICAVTYDVHGGKYPSQNGGVGIPGKAQEIQAGDTSAATGNADNGVEQNAKTPLGNACPAFFFPAISTTATGGAFDASGAASISDKISLSGADPKATGFIRLKAFGPGDSGCTGTAVGSADIALAQTNGTVNHDYNGSFPVVKFGSYNFTADLFLGTSNTAATSSKCGSANETAIVAAKGPSLGTTAGGPFRVGSNGKFDLTDSATLSNATSDATGTVTFTLYSVCGGSSLGTATATVTNGAVNNPSTSISVGPGQYHWAATYGGDDKNSSASSACGSNGENPLVVNPGITVTKLPHSQSVLSGSAVTWTITVTNTGDSTLTGVYTTDDQAPDCARTGLGSLDAGQSLHYDCTLSVVTSPLDNVVTACGTPTVGADVCDDSPATADARTGHVGIESYGSTQTILPNDTATVTVIGTGISPLNGNLTFQLYKGSCDPGNLIKDFGSSPVDANGTAGTSNASFTVSGDGTYNWLVSYGGDTNGNSAFTGACGTEHFSIANG